MRAELKEFKKKRESNCNGFLGGKKKKRERGKIKGLRMTVTQKGTGSIYKILIILYFQLLHLLDKKRKPRVYVVP